MRKYKHLVKRKDSVSLVDEEIFFLCKTDKKDSDKRVMVNEGVEKHLS